MSPIFNYFFISKQIFFSIVATFRIQLNKLVYLLKLFLKSSKIIDLKLRLILVLFPLNLTLFYQFSSCINPVIYQPYFSDLPIHQIPEG